MLPSTSNAGDRDLHVSSNLAGLDTSGQTDAELPLKKATVSRRPSAWRIQVERVERENQDCFP